MLSSRTVVTEIADIVEICHFVTTKTEHAQTDVNPDINNTIANNLVTKDSTGLIAMKRVVVASMSADVST